MVQSQPRKIVHETLSWKNPSQKRAGGVIQVVGPKFKPQKQKISDAVNWEDIYITYVLYVLTSRHSGMTGHSELDSVKLKRPETFLKFQLNL
jgi:hypothetical protein